MTYLFDTNIWFEILLGRAASSDSIQLIRKIGGRRVLTTDFSLYTLGIVLSPTRSDLLKKLVDDWIAWGIGVTHLSPAHMPAVLEVMNRFQIDFDDSVQYFTAQ